MTARVVSVKYDAGSLSAPAFLDLEVKDDQGDIEKIMLMGKRAKRMSSVKVGDFYVP